MASPLKSSHGFIWNCYFFILFALKNLYIWNLSSRNELGRNMILFSLSNSQTVANTDNQTIHILPSLPFFTVAKCCHIYYMHSSVSLGLFWMTLLYCSFHLLMLYSFNNCNYITFKYLIGPVLHYLLFTCFPYLYFST